MSRRSMKVPQDEEQKDLLKSASQDDVERLIQRMNNVNASVKSLRRFEMFHTLISSIVMIVLIIFLATGYNVNVTSTMSNFHDLSNDPLTYSTSVETKMAVEQGLQSISRILNDLNIDSNGDPIDYRSGMLNLLSVLNSTGYAINILLPKIEHAVDNLETTTTNLNRVFGGTPAPAPAP